MTLRVVPTQSPPLNVVAPFFVAAPLMLVLAGAGIALLGSESFIAVNSHHNVAITHAIVLGWLTLTIMGALYQLGPAVLAAATRSVRLVRLQFAVHVAGLLAFIPSVWQWNLAGMAIGGSLLTTSVVLFLANTIRFRGLRESPIPIMYVRAAQAGLLVTVVLGITFVGNHEHAWFAITPGRLAVHAHAGLIGWIGLTLMGVSYQLVPMFNVVRGARPRFAKPALGLTLIALIGFAIAMIYDPPRIMRLAVAGPILAAFALWATDMIRLLRARSRRIMDIQGHSMVVSLAFLFLAGWLAAGAAWGTPFGTGDQPARWPLAYGLAAALGWAGTALVGNTHKIVPFLVWYHRYRAHMGEVAVPLMTDLYSERFATSTLVIHGLATLVLAGSALAGEIALFRLGGALLASSGLLQTASMLWILAPRRIRKSSRRRTAVGAQT